MAWPPDRPRNGGQPPPRPGYGRGDPYYGERPRQGQPRELYGPSERYQPYQPYQQTVPEQPAAPEPLGPAGRLVLVVCAVVAMLVLVVSSVGWLGLRHYEGKVAHVPLTFPAGVPRPAAAGRGTQAILLVGSDAREGSQAEALGERSDTTILAYLRADGTTTLLSFPRDLWVTIPAYTDASGADHQSQQSKLNAAFSYGGPSLLIQTIEGLTHIRVDHYVEVNFAGFQAMTDAVGGVTVCVLPLSADQQARGFNNLADEYSGWHGQVGENHLNGTQALAFVRQRHGLPSGDFDRIHRQQHFLGALFRQAASTETLTSPSALTALLDATTSALTLDEGTSLTDLQRLAVRMQGVGSGGVMLQTVKTRTQIQDSGASTEVYDPAELDALLAEITGRQPSEGAASVGAGAVGAGATLAAARPVAAAGLLPAWPVAAGASTATAAGSGEPNPASCVY